jgi:hypothetical protein
LLDVLFILVFASLARAAAVTEQRDAARAAEAADAAPPDATQPDAAQPDAASLDEEPADAAPVPQRDRIELHQEALRQLAAVFAELQPVIVRISVDGDVVAIEVGTAAAADDRVVKVPLLEKASDPDVGLSYLGDRSADLRVCNIARRHLDRADLADLLVILAPEAPLAELRVALALGLERDRERCNRDTRGVAILVDPRAKEDGGP